MCREMTPWEKAVDFHGHTCPGLVLGYRAAMAAMEHFGQGRSVDEEMVAVVETDACGVDAIQVITGCTFGKGNLVYRDMGKQVFSFGFRGRPEGLRVALKYGSPPKFAPPEWDELREKVSKGEAGEEEKARYRQLHDDFINRLLEAPLEELMETKTVEMELPFKAQIHQSVKCDSCGEGVMEPRAEQKGDMVVCKDCI